MNNKNEMPMYKWYQKFYKATKSSTVYKKYCEEVFGKTFSQHGFSDIKQITKLLDILKIHSDELLLDLGCGNGSIAEYISDLTNTHVHGIDYLDEAINFANERTNSKRDKLSFKTGLIGEPLNQNGFFDTIISVDTIFFGKDMKKTISYVVVAIKPGGQLAIIVSEFLINKSDDINKFKSDNTDVAKALSHNNLKYDVYDFTKIHYEHMKLKNTVIRKMKPLFEKEGNIFLYNNILNESFNERLDFDIFQGFSCSTYII